MGPGQLQVSNYIYPSSSQNNAKPLLLLPAPPLSSLPHSDPLFPLFKPPPTPSLSQASRPLPPVLPSGSKSPGCHADSHGILHCPSQALHLHPPRPLPAGGPFCLRLVVLPALSLSARSSPATTLPSQSHGVTVTVTVPVCGAIVFWSRSVTVWVLLA
jgi:hypothetical protein